MTSIPTSLAVCAVPVARADGRRPWSRVRRRLLHATLRHRDALAFAIRRRHEREVWLGVAREIVASPDHSLIPRHPLAGRLRRGRLVMHNGLEVLPTGYLGHQFLLRARLTGGVDEPQQERIFGDLLPQIAPGGTMLELGSHWAFYSAWFLKTVPEARGVVVEPVRENLLTGITNLELNGIRDGVEVILGFAGGRAGQRGGLPVTTVDEICRELRLDRVAVLHADVEGSEVGVLHGAREMLRRHRVDYVFVSTHDEGRHRLCREILGFHGYGLMADVTLVEAYQADGLLVAARPGLPEQALRPVAKRPGGRRSEAFAAAAALAASRC